jgi:hypothetical protein
MQWSIGKTRARNDEPQHMHTVQSLGGALGGRPQMPWQNMHHAVEPPKHRTGRRCGSGPEWFHSCCRQLCQHCTWQPKGSKRHELASLRWTGRLRTNCEVWQAYQHHWPRLYAIAQHHYRPSRRRAAPHSKLRSRCVTLPVHRCRRTTNCAARRGAALLACQPLPHKKRRVCFVPTTI